MELKKKTTITLLTMMLVAAAATKADTGYSLASLNGNYGYTSQGTYQANIPVVAVGLLQTDGAGNLSGRETAQVYGAGSVIRTYKGTYTVNADGTGSLVINYDPSPADPTDANGNDIAVLNISYSFVIVNGKTEIHGVRLENGAVVTANFTKQ
jgi:hypothetical protein